MNRNLWLPVKTRLGSVSFSEAVCASRRG